jgi:anti-sigma factor RsiW
MTCLEIADFLMDYLSGELPPDVRAQFDRHLSVCPNCRAYIATYQATIDLGRKAFAAPDADAQAEVPEELVSAILDSFRR